jgi:hypothetical protein
VILPTTSPAAEAADPADVADLADVAKAADSAEPAAAKAVPPRAEVSNVRRESVILASLESGA